MCLSLLPLIQTASELCSVKNRHFFYPKCKFDLLLDEDALALQADSPLLLLTKITYRCTGWLRIKYLSEVFGVIIIGKDFRAKFPDFKKEYS